MNNINSGGYHYERLWLPGSFKNSIFKAIDSAFLKI